MMKIDITHSLPSFWPFRFFLFLLWHWLQGADLLLIIHFFMVFIVLSEIARAALLGAINGASLVPCGALVLEHYIYYLLVVYYSRRFIIYCPLCFNFILLLYY